MTSILELCRELPLRSYVAGECVLAEGQNTGMLYVLENGRVRVRKGEHEICRVAEPGAVFGEMSVLLGEAHTATVDCLEASRFHVAADAAVFLEAHPALGLHLARLLAQRLNSVTRYLVDLKSQFAEQKDHLGMVDEVLESLVHRQRRSRTV